MFGESEYGRYSRRKVNRRIKETLQDAYEIAYDTLSTMDTEDFGAVHGQESFDTSDFNRTPLPGGKEAVLRGVLPSASRTEGIADPEAVVSVEVIDHRSEEVTIYSLKGTPFQVLEHGPVEGVFMAASPQADPKRFQKNGEPLSGLAGLKEAFRFRNIVKTIGGHQDSWVAGPK